MTKVSNRAVIRRLAFREFRAARRMNFVVILSIVLTCILFTALTSIGGSLINGGQQETMRQVGGNRMAGVKYVLPEDYERIKADSATRDVVYHIIVGRAVNDKLKDLTVEVNVAGDEDAAAAAFCAVTTGRLPENSGEIAASLRVIDALGLPHELGTTVPIRLDVDGEITEHEFTLCGFWEGDRVAMAQQCYVSADFADEYAPTPAGSFYSNEHTTYAGYWQVDFNYPNSWDIEGKTDALMMRLYGDSENAPDIGINWAYGTSSIDGGMLATCIVMVLLIFGAGYLIIYNIFHINISANIRSYGLLKTIGTTSKQIRRMVRIQAAIYSVIGIPVGLAAGVILSRTLMSSIMKIINLRSADSYSVGGELMVLICIISALFTFATVMISCRKPCRIAGSVSPIEALRYNETDISSYKTDKKTGRISPLSVARNNMSRSRKKTAVVVLSLTLSMVLTNTLFTVLDGIDEDKYIKDSIVGDVIVRHAQNTDVFQDMVKGITPEMIDDLSAVEGAEVHPVYYDSKRVYIDGEQFDRLKKLYEKYKKNEEQELELSSAMSGHYSANVYGIDGSAAEFFEPDEGSIDVDKLMSGKYAVVSTYLTNADKDSDVELYHVGDTITVGSDDNRHEYEVMAVCSMPYPLSTKMYDLFMTQVMVSADEYMKITDEPGAVCVMMNTGDEAESVKETIRAYCDRDGSQLVYLDKQTYINEFRDFISTVRLVGGTLSGILALIGILNFVNAVVTGIVSRKRELAMMNAVGMTGRQLKSMLMWEGIHYALLTAGCSVVFGLLIDLVAIRGIARGLFFFSYHFTMLPMLICVPVLILLSAVIPNVSYRTICKDSIVERLREN